MSVRLSGTFLILLHSVWMMGDCSSADIRDFPDVNGILGKPLVDIRLQGSEAPGEGYVELHIADRWVRICDKHWNDIDTQVACRSLGYEFGYPWFHQQENSPPLTSPLLEQVACIGNEMSLLDCPKAHEHNRLENYTACILLDYAGVMCKNNSRYVDDATQQHEQFHKNILELLRCKKNMKDTSISCKNISEECPVDKYSTRHVGENATSQDGLV